MYSLSSPKLQTRAYFFCNLVPKTQESHHRNGPTNVFITFLIAITECIHAYIYSEATWGRKGFWTVVSV